jgi:hypothetical protein
MKIYQDKNISDQTFELEEAVFINCSLKNCDLFYSGGDTEFVNLRIDGCRFHFRGAAKNTQQLFLTLGMINTEKMQPVVTGSLSTQGGKPN